MAARRLEKYRRKPSEVNNNEHLLNEINALDQVKAQTPQELIRDWFKCICFRPRAVVMCGNPYCGFRAFGRVRKLCRAHPKDTYLLDLPMCPNCHHAVHEVPSKLQQNTGGFY